MNPTDAYRKQIRKREIKRVSLSDSNFFIFELEDDIVLLWRLYDFDWIHIFVCSQYVNGGFNISAQVDKSAYKKRLPLS